MDHTTLLPIPSHCNEANSNDIAVGVYVHKGQGKISKASRVSLNWLLGVNSLVCGVEIVSCAGFTYIPPLLLKAGYSETQMTIILGIAPILCLLSVPVLAEWSDRCTSVIGRRRPFIIVLSIVLIVSLLVIPYGPGILSLIYSGTNTSVANMLILAFGVILLDYSYQALFNPCESLLSDLMAQSSEDDQTKGFTVYSASMSLGCILGYFIVSVDWSSVGFMIGNQEQTCFCVVFLLFLPCLFLTLFLSEEKPFSGVTSSGKLNLHSQSLLPQVKINTAHSLDLNDEKIEVLQLLPDNLSEGGYKIGYINPEENVNAVVTNSKMFRLRYQRLTYQISRLRIAIQRIIKTIIGVLAKLLLFLVLLPPQLLKLPTKTWQRVSNSPTVLRRLFLAELFGYMGLLCHNMFFTDFVGQYVYRGIPDAQEQTEFALLYDEGVRMGSLGLLLHSTTACLYAFLIHQHLVYLIGHRVVFIGGLTIFSITMAATIVSPSLTFLNTVTAISGIGFAVLTSTRNMLVTLYNTDRQLFMWDCKKKAKSPDEESGLGADFAVLDMAYILSQILLSICMGPLVDLTGSSLSYMVVAALAGCVSVYYASQVVFNKGHLKQLKAGKFQPLHTENYKK